MAVNAGRKRSSILTAAESVLQLSLIPLSLALFAQIIAAAAKELEVSLNAEAAKELEAILSASDGKWLAAALFLALAAARAVRAFRLREKGKGFFTLSLIQAGAFLIGAALPLACGFNSSTLSYLSALYSLTMIAGRVFSIIRDHRARNVPLNVFCILVLLLSLLSFIAADMLILFLAVLALMQIIFARVSLDVLLKIIRKTYAAEIIFGLLLLIVTFSFLLSFFEPGMESMKDALWYCFAIVTTIGFGDITAVTDLGRVLSVILGVYGIVVVVLITSIIVNFYGEMKKEGDIQEDEANDA